MHFIVCVEGDKFPAAMLVRELEPGVLDGRKWYYRDSPVMNVLPEEANAYDDTLTPKERKQTFTQEEFYIMSHFFCGIVLNKDFGMSESGSLYHPKVFIFSF